VIYVIKTLSQKTVYMTCHFKWLLFYQFLSKAFDSWPNRTPRVYNAFYTLMFSHN